MKITPIDKNAIDKYTKLKKTDIDKLFDDFRDSGFECVEVKDFHHKDAKTCYQSLYNYLKRNRIYTVKIMVRGDRVFLIKVKI